MGTPLASLPAALPVYVAQAWRYACGRCTGRGEHTIPWVPIPRLSGTTLPQGGFHAPDHHELRDGGAAATVRDSAGIQIVENVQPAWKGDRWRVADDPLLSLGTIDGPPEHQFHSLRGVVRLQDGTLVVANGGSRELRYFDGGGRYLRTAGGPGGGPGEFEEISKLIAGPADSVLVYDFRQRRISIFDSAGEFARSVTFEVDAGEGVPYVLAWQDDGSFIVSLTTVYGSGEVGSGLVRDPLQYRRYAADGTPAASLGRFPDQERYISSHDGGITVTSPLFARYPVQASGGAEFVVGANDSYELAHFAAGDTTFRRLIRVREQPREADAKQVRQAQENRLARISDAELRRRVEHTLTQAPVPRHLPFYGAALFDSEDNLWVQNYRAPADAQTVWRVFDAEGRWLGDVPFPERFQATQIGDDFVLGIVRDDLDVEHVHMLALEKG